MSVDAGQGFGLGMALCAVLLAACTNTGESTSGARRPAMDAAGPPATPIDASATDGAGARAIIGDSVRDDLVFEIRKAVDGPGAPFESFNYLCGLCTPDDVPAFERAALPPGFARTEGRTLLAARARLYVLENAEGQPRALDLLPSIAGAEFELGAAPQRGTFIQGSWVQVDLRSDRVLEWNVGDVVHEVTDGAATYVAFLVEQGTDPESLESMPLPDGWTHVRRTLETPLLLDARGAPQLFLALATPHLWQRE